MANQAAVEDLYLDARYACEALRARIRSKNPQVAAELREAMNILCSELRGLLAEKGVDRVERKFPRELLEKPVEELARLCLDASRRLRRATGSAAAERLIAAVSRLGVG